MVNTFDLTTEAQAHGIALVCRKNTHGKIVEYGAREGSTLTRFLGRQGRDQWVRLRIHAIKANSEDY